MTFASRIILVASFFGSLLKTSLPFGSNLPFGTNVLLESTLSFLTRPFLVACRSFEELYKQNPFQSRALGSAHLLNVGLLRGAKPILLWRPLLHMHKVHKMTIKCCLFTCKALSNIIRAIVTH